MLKEAPVKTTVCTIQSTSNQILLTDNLLSDQSGICLKLNIPRNICRHCVLWSVNSVMSCQTALACFLCNGRVFSLATHLKTVHGRRTRKVRLATCPYCGRPYRTIDEYFKHLYRRHPTSPPRNSF